MPNEMIDDGGLVKGALPTDDETKKSSSRPLDDLIVQIREDVLRMKDGEFLGSQEDLLARYNLTLPVLRQVAAWLMQEQLISSRRGVGGGFFVRRPDAKSVTHIIALYLRTRGVALSDQIATLLPVRAEVARRAALSKDAAAKRDLVKFLEEEKQSELQLDFQSFSTAERKFILLLARISGSETLTLFLEILFDLSAMIHHEADVFQNNPERRVMFRRARNRIADAVLAGDESEAVQHAEECSQLSWYWMSGAQPDSGIESTDRVIGHRHTFGGRTPDTSGLTAPLDFSFLEEDADVSTESNSALAALKKLEKHRDALERRRLVLRQAACQELGEAVLDAGGAHLEVSQLKQFIERILALGPEAAMQRLTK